MAENIKTQMRIHTGESLCMCSTFGRDRFRIHTGEKLYTCSACGETFSKAGTLESHMMVHTGRCHSPVVHLGKHLRQNPQESNGSTDRGDAMLV